MVVKIIMSMNSVRYGASGAPKNPVPRPAPQRALSLKIVTTVVIIRLEKGGVHPLELPSSFTSYTKLPFVG